MWMVRDYEMAVVVILVLEKEDRFKIQGKNWFMSVDLNRVMMAN